MSRSARSGARALVALLALTAAPALASPTLGAASAGGTSEAVRIAVILAIMAIIPAILISTTSFIRIVVVLAMVRHAFGMPQTPPNAVLTSLALFMTAFVMSPTLGELNDKALQPMLNGTQAVSTVIETGSAPLRDFMLSQTRESDLEMIYRMSGTPLPATPQDVELLKLTPAFIEQLAYEALIQSVDRFEPYKSVPFEAFARMRINGHIANGLAQTSEAAAQYRYRQRAERDRLRSLRNPADALADPIAALSSLSAAIAIGLMLEADFSSAVEAIPDPAPSAYDSLAWNELHRHVHGLIDALPDQEAYVVQQHYRNDVSFQQIAVLMGLSKGRVSQIHRAALQRLRGRLAKLR